MRRVGLPIERLPDETLLAGLAAGDPEIALAFVRRFQGKVFAVAVAVLGDPGLAEDVAQQAFERALRHASVYDARRGSVGAWLTTIAHNLAVDVARARKPVPVDPADLVGLLVVASDSPESRALAAETSGELRTALAALPPEQARALLLAAIYGMTARQVAEFERIPHGTAKTRIRAAMQKLRNTLTATRASHE